MLSDGSGCEPWIVHPAAVADLDGCAELAAGYEGEAAAVWRRRFVDQLAGADGDMFVAAQGTRVVGYGRVQLLTDGSFPAKPPLPVGYYLSGVVVEAAYRGHGVGRRLCESRMAWAAERSDRLWFFTNVRNRASRALHARVGFREVGAFTSPQLDGGQGILGMVDLPVATLPPAVAGIC